MVITKEILESKRACKEGVNVHVEETAMTKQEIKAGKHERISVDTQTDPYERDIVLGDLTDRQYTDLETVVRLSSGYHFTVVRYNGGPSSSATHVLIWRDGNDNDYVGLVGRQAAQWYDGSKETEQVVRRIANKVYRRTVNF